MPQEFHVLRCYECETFQVHIIKKSKKWDCKMCGAKQSLKKVYFCGTGKECRFHVQSLNEKRIITDSFKTIHNQSYEEEQTIENIQIDPENSKWNEFLVQENENSVPEIIENLGMSFERPIKRRKYKKENNFVKNKKKSNVENDNISGENENFVEKESVWNNFVTDDNSDEENLEFNQQNCEESTNYFETGNTQKSKQSKWNCFMPKENEHGNEEKEICKEPKNIFKENNLKPNQENVQKTSKWNCFLREHEENQDAEKSYENKISSKENLFNQIDENLDFLDIDL